MVRFYRLEWDLKYHQYTEYVNLLASFCLTEEDMDYTFESLTSGLVDIIKVKDACQKYNEQQRAFNDHDRDT